MEVSRFAGKVTIPHRFAEPFGPGPLCRCATSPHTVGSHPLHKGAFLRGVGDAAPLQLTTNLHSPPYRRLFSFLPLDNCAYCVYTVYIECVQFDHKEIS